MHKANIYLVTIIKPVNVGWGDIYWEPVRELVEAPTSIFAVNNVLHKHKGESCELKDVRLVESFITKENVGA